MPSSSAIDTKDVDLRPVISHCQEAWPHLAVDPTAFTLYLAQRLPSARGMPSQALQQWCVTDLYLAYACVTGNPIALNEFDKRLRAAAPVIARVDRSPAFQDEVMQRLGQKLLVAPVPGEMPRLAQYSGQGSLDRWLKVALHRTAIEVARQQGRDVPCDPGELEAALVQQDPEAEILLTLNHDEMQDAFRHALSTLSAKERNILRLHMVARISMEKIGATYRMHRTTVARVIADARTRLVEQTRKELEERMRLTPSQLDSMMRALPDVLEISLSWFLDENQAKTE